MKAINLLAVCLISFAKALFSQNCLLSYTVKRDRAQVLPQSLFEYFRLAIAYSIFALPKPFFEHFKPPKIISPNFPGRCLVRGSTSSKISISFHYFNQTLVFVIF